MKKSALIKIIEEKVEATISEGIFGKGVKAYKAYKASRALTQALSRLTQRAGQGISRLNTSLKNKHAGYSRKVYQPLNDRLAANKEILKNIRALNSDLKRLNDPKFKETLTKTRTKLDNDYDHSISNEYSRVPKELQPAGDAIKQLKKEFHYGDKGLRPMYDKGGDMYIKDRSQHDRVDIRLENEIVRAKVELEQLFDNLMSSTRPPRY